MAVLFYFQRLEALTANTSDGKPLTDFQREQFGGTVGGPIRKDKAFYFLAFEGILEELTRAQSERDDRHALSGAGSGDHKSRP